MRRLTDIETTEVSLVDKPAIKKKFLFFKQDNNKKKKVKLTIESDGTVGGTKISSDGEELKGLRSFNFGFWPPPGVEPSKARVDCSYTKETDTTDGFKRTETFYLSKGDSKMDPELIKLLKELLGEEDSKEVDFEKAEELSDKAINAIKAALKLVNKYKGDFPDDLKKAVGVLAKYAGYGYGYPGKKAGVEKAGAKFSKETLEKLKNVVKALEDLKSILPELKVETQKTDDDTKDTKATTGIDKSAEERIVKSISELEDKKVKELGDKLEKTLGEVSKRLEAVEQGTGIRKSVEGQDDDETVDEDGKKIEDPFPSIKIT